MGLLRKCTEKAILSPNTGYTFSFISMLSYWCYLLRRLLLLDDVFRCHDVCLPFFKRKIAISFHRELGCYIFSVFPLTFIYFSAGIVIEEKNWPPFFPLIHHDISNEIPIHLQRMQYLAFSSFLGKLSVKNVLVSTTVLNPLSLSLSLSLT